MYVCTYFSCGFKLNLNTNNINYRNDDKKFIVISKYLIIYCGYFIFNFAGFTLIF